MALASPVYVQGMTSPIRSGCCGVAIAAVPMSTVGLWRFWSQL
jgi:hypothetical protein